MSDQILMQFVGFESTPTVREYTFTVRQASVEPREFTITIAQEAFRKHRISFQDAPSICSLKLRRELTANGNDPPESHFHISDAELDEYRSSHASPKRTMFHRRPT